MAHSGDLAYQCEELVIRLDPAREPEPPSKYRPVLPKDNDVIFKQIIDIAINLREIDRITSQEIAAQFEVAESTVLRWAEGEATPHPRIQKEVAAWLMQEEQKSYHAFSCEGKWYMSPLCKQDEASALTVPGKECDGYRLLGRNYEKAKAVVEEKQQILDWQAEADTNPPTSIDIKGEKPITYAWRVVSERAFSHLSPLMRWPSPHRSVYTNSLPRIFKRRETGEAFCKMIAEKAMKYHVSDMKANGYEPSEGYEWYEGRDIEIVREDDRSIIQLKGTVLGSGPAEECGHLFGWLEKVEIVLE
jgi:transcriptional regulator with XRE-family HTH domain